MKNLVKLAYVLPVLLFFSCNQSAKSLEETTNANDIYWVSGYKTACSLGAGKGECLLVSESEKDQTLENASNWKTFSAPIEGFTFEEGYAKQIEVAKENIENPPADASSIKFTLVNELAKVNDNRRALNGSWTLATLNGHPLNKMVVIPNLQIDLTNKTFAGNNGCNDFTATIKSLDFNKIELMPAATTGKMCIKMEVPNEFNTALEQIVSYKVDGSNLYFLNANGDELFMFLKNDQSASIANSWLAVRINGGPINKKVVAPTLDFNLEENIVSGNNSCNSYSAVIKSLKDNSIELGNVMATEMACPDMSTADAFNKAIQEVVSFKIDKDLLTLYNAEGTEVLAFLLVK